MPQLGETVAEGTISKWFVKAGDSVKPGDNLFEIETDKVSMEVPAISAGTIAAIHVQAGELAPVVLPQPTRHAAANELLNISGVAAKHFRERGERDSPLNAQMFEHNSGVEHDQALMDRQVPRQVGIALGNNRGRVVKIIRRTTKCICFEK